MVPKEIKFAEPVTEPVGEDFVPIDIPDRLQDDYLVKFMRIRFDDQDDYLAGLKNARDRAEEDADRKKMDIEVHRIKKELERIGALRSSFASTPENDFAMRLFDWHRASWKKHAKENCEHNSNTLETRVKQMELEGEDPARRLEWERRILYKVHKWPNDPIPPKPKSPQEERKERQKKEEEKKQALEKRRKSLKGILEAIFQDRAEDEVHNTKKKKRAEPEKEPRNRPPDSYGLTVSEITLKKTKPSDQSFMSYEMKKPSLNDCLFKKENNPLTAKCKDNTIRYFHIPANNMHWIEEAIARYYNENTDTRPEYNYRQAKNYLKRSSDLLCREFWTSLQHGGNYDPVHARHMRAHCSRITPEKTYTDGASRNNFIVFMPYLHWESHKRRKKMSEETKKLTQKYQESRVHVTEDMKTDFIRMSDQIRIQHARALTGFHTPDQPEENEKEEEKKTKARKEPRKPLEPGPLGYYLLNIAKLYDAMDVEPDVRMLRDHLFQDPPLHARRTLDQSYYWKLPNTDGRDQDQVVFRETKEGKHISRTTRVVMVDQLWMYILDDNTIITSFPRRWGRNKPDHSGVHKAIRARLDNLRVGQVQSVYDLALLIMNQCSTVFFDLTKPVDERPEVLDIFSNALSHVSGMKTVAYETFWRHLDKLNATDRQLADFEVTARSYLNINPEGELLKEVHDIIEELRMMARIYTHQLHVLEDFSRHLEIMHQQDEKNAPKKLVDVMLEIKNLLGTTFTPHSAEDPLAAQHNQSPTHNGTARLTTNEATNGATNGAANGDDAAANASSISESTVEFAKRVCNNITLRRKELQDLEESSIGVSDQLRDLLSLKQQQASIIEAKLALKRADESVIQGRSIMLFTIVTIIFLPLSFMTSVFGMNAAEFSTPSGGNSMSLKHQFKLIFPISVGVIVVSISLAFSPWIRSIIGFLTHIIFATIIEYTYVRRIWTWIIGKHTPDGVYENKQELVKKIYSRKERENLRRQQEIAVKNEKEKERINARGETGDGEVGCLAGFRRRRTGVGSPV